MSAPQTMAEAIHMIDTLQFDLDKAHRDLAVAHAMIATLRGERDTWRSATGR